MPNLERGQVEDQQTVQGETLHNEMGHSFLSVVTTSRKAILLGFLMSTLATAAATSETYENICCKFKKGMALN